MSDSGEVAEAESYQDSGIQRPEWDVYPQTIYKFDYNTTKVGSGLIFRLSDEVLSKRVRSYMVSGMRITVCGVILSHIKGFPSVLLVQREGDRSLGLLGGKCKSFENPKEALSAKLARFITSTKHRHQINIKEDVENIQVGDLLGDLWRCDFNTEPLPYLPLHSNRPKEKISLYQVTVSENCKISVPRGFTLRFVPLYDFYNPEFGLSIGAIPHLLSRFNISYMYD
ncbi:mRNA cleavage factor subunit [Theileria orientalis strain Shintoku]|uniref:Cleavage and polyadenylation specificity factor subunit 5 n=1 Tax=Theileria orientalis strain Shintoku TaxID=869250 RepID=J4DAE5_THEOR|nr:mRNA cleavage factor subunit [Theileria orientalis strain Shintoku]BAM41925.1 mRNA cleavage factor subunit [Theileria orientalis strain Shintoku]|eukprot:XP_009692226.1 mRNA cleavage factor subunit [Theileria orientalis strain Shintoku]